MRLIPIEESPSGFGEWAPVLREHGYSLPIIRRDRLYARRDDLDGSVQQQNLRPIVMVLDETAVGGVSGPYIIADPMATDWEYIDTLPDWSEVRDA